MFLLNHAGGPRVVLIEITPSKGVFLWNHQSLTHLLARFVCEKVPVLLLVEFTPWCPVFLFNLQPTRDVFFEITPSKGAFFFGTTSRSLTCLLASSVKRSRCCFLLNSRRGVLFSCLISSPPVVFCFNEITPSKSVFSLESPVAHSLACSLRLSKKIK